MIKITIKRKIKKAQSAITIVYGPPCAGKSTYVDKVSGAGDVVVDYDILARALGSTVAHGVSGSIRSVAFAVRETAIFLILKGLDDPAFIIHTNPTTDKISDYKKAGATFVLVDPGLEECLSRAENRPANTREAIEAWYKNPPAITPDTVIFDRKKSVVYI